MESYVDGAASLLDVSNQLTSTRDKARELVNAMDTDSLIQGTTKLAGSVMQLSTAIQSAFRLVSV